MKIATALSQKKLKTVLRSLLRWTLLVFLVGLIVWQVIENRADYVQLYDRLTWGYFLIVCGLQIGLLFLQSLRTRIIISRLRQQEIPFFDWFRLLAASRLLNLFMTQAGNVYRAHSSKKRYGIPYADYVASYIVFLWIDTVMCLGLAYLLMGYFYLHYPGAGLDGAPDTAFLLAAFVTVLIALPAGTGIVRYILQSGSFWRQTRAVLLNATSAIHTSIRDFGMLARLVPLGLLSISLLILLFWICFSLLGASIQIYQIAFIVVFFRLTVTVMLTPGNLGVREWVLVGACGFFGIDTALALTVALFHRVSGMLAIFVIGLPSFFCLTAQRSEHAEDPRQNRTDEFLS